MQAEVRPLYHCGKPLPKSQRNKEPASRGKLYVGEDRLHAFGRVVICAKLTSATDGVGALLLPELVDVQIIWFEDGIMRLRGAECIDGTLYSQAWEARMLPC